MVGIKAREGTEKNIKTISQQVTDFEIDVSNRNIRNGYSPGNINCYCLKDVFLVSFILFAAIIMCWTLAAWTAGLEHIEEEIEIYHEDLPFNDDNFSIVSRLDWLAKPPSDELANLKTPVSMVIIHHTATTPCFRKSACVLRTRYIQSYHMDSNGWSDIGYNFLVGGDGEVYEGRGWLYSGAHTRRYNNRSIGVGFIGTFLKVIPPEKQIKAFFKLLDYGLHLGYLSTDFKIYGGCQFSDTQSPGEVFYEEIKTWDRWSEIGNKTS